MNIPSLKTIIAFLCVFCNTKKVDNNTVNLNEQLGVVQKTIPNKQLDNCLKQLEFISYLEINIENSDHYSLDFLQELSQIKYSAQMNTLNLM